MNERNSSVTVSRATVAVVVVVVAASAAAAGAALEAALNVIQR
jgi:hypothetical protein